jgi:signal transduction histidine kinase
VSKKSPHESAGRTENLVKASAPLEDHERWAAIQKAKFEWECTVDALSVLVCLLNAKGTVLRANRVVERWGLGSVGGVVGHNAHAVLHPGCRNQHCEVTRGFADAAIKLKSGETHEFEYHSPNDQKFSVTLRPMRAPESAGVQHESRTVLVVADVSALGRTQMALENANLNLESRVRVRTRELYEANRDLRSEVGRREEAQQELRASRNNLALLTEQLIQAQEIERRRIAMELHDSVGQSLSAIKYTLERAIIMLQRGNLGSPEGLLASAVQQIHGTADGIRRISTNLRPTILDSLGAASAASWFCREFGEIYPALNVGAHITVQDQEIPQRIATHLFRCVQELLNNVAKHARARNVWIVLKRNQTALSLSVRDDGVGLPDRPQDPSRLAGSGLRNLRERTEMTGGEFSLTSAPEGGTAAHITWVLGPGDGFVECH